MYAPAAQVTVSQHTAHSTHFTQVIVSHLGEMSHRLSVCVVLTVFGAKVCGSALVLGCCKGLVQLIYLLKVQL